MEKLLDSVKTRCTSTQGINKNERLVTLHVCPVIIKLVWLTDWVSVSVLVEDVLFVGVLQ